MSGLHRRGELILVIGGSGSGKSAYAEGLLDGFSGEKYYIATMQAQDGESRRKIGRHRENRAGKGFVTVEQPKNIKAVRGCAAGECAALLEDLPNLVANEMFAGEQMRRALDVAEQVAGELLELLDGFGRLVVVTGNVFADGVLYEESTVEYLDALALLNQRLAEAADRVVEVVAGIPVTLKEGSK